MKRRIFLQNVLVLFLVLIFTVSLLSGCAQPEVPDTSTDGKEDGKIRFDRNIKVGIVDTYSGPATVYTYDARDGFKLALSEINAEGIYGAQMEFVTRDEEFAPDKALSWSRELVTREEVDVLAGYMSSASALAVSEYVRDEKIPMIAWMAQSERITGEDGHRYTFSVDPTHGDRIHGSPLPGDCLRLPG